MHVLFDALNVRWGGGLTVLNRLVDAFARRGHMATVLLGDQILAGSFAAGPLVRPHPVVGSTTAVATLRFRHTKLARLTQQLRPDALFSLNYFTPTRVPQVTYHINVIPYLPLSDRIRAVGFVRAMLHARYARKALKQSDLNLFESRFVMELAAREGPIYNGRVAHIGTELSNQRRQTHEDAGRKTIACVTSGAAHKRNDVVLKAFVLLRAQFPNLRLQFIGNPEPIKRSLPDTMWRGLAEEGALDFVGYLDRAALFDTLSQVSCLITASELESFFMVAIEAMSVGCPVVAADISSIRESVGENALLFPAGNEAGAAEQVARILAQNNPVTEASARAWAQSFDGQRCADKIVGIMECQLGEVSSPERIRFGASEPLL